MLVHRVQKHYPVEMIEYERVMNEHGTAAAATFTLSPHPNEVLKLFWECDVKQCLPVAFYEAAARGVISLTSSKPKVALPPQILTPSVRALGTFNGRHVDHVRATLDTVHDCNNCRRANFNSIEHSLLPTKSDLSLSLLRDPGLKPDVARMLCDRCITAIIGDDNAFRYVFWDELPGVFGLPNWRELSKYVILK